MDYTKFYKDSFSPCEDYKLPEYDFFISAYDECDRTIIPYKKINSKRKIWMFFPQYIYHGEKPDGNIYYDEGRQESEYFRNFINNYGKELLTADRICIDSTGFLRPHLLYFMSYLNFKGLKKVDILYTEPVMYSNADETTFSKDVECVRTIEGCSCSPNTAGEMNDVLIVCSGYDEKLFSAVASYKSNCKYKYHIIGFPSLQPDMYQESMLRFYNIQESVGNSLKKFAPAFDPFVTAQTIDKIIKEVNCKSTVTNVFLSPLSTKPQTLGMLLYYLYNKKNMAVNILFPFSLEYTSGHTKGVKRTWLYTMEFPNY